MALTNFSNGADEHLLLNTSLELKCLIEREADKANHHEVNLLIIFDESKHLFKTMKHIKEEGNHCMIDFDGILCWPRTKFDQIVSQPCFEELNTVKYDITSKYHIK